MSIVNAIWNIFIITGCSYVVFFKGYSGWWFLVAVGILDYDKRGIRDEQDRVNPHN